MLYRELVRGLAEKAGIAGEVEIDDEERCLLSFDGMDVVIQGMDAAHAVAFVAPVGEPPPERPERLYRMLLEANHAFGGTGGATLSVNPDGGYVYLCRQLDVRTLGVDEFAKALEQFLNALEAWRTLVRDYRARPVDAEPGAAESPPFPSDAFLRI